MRKKLFLSCLALLFSVCGKTQNQSDACGTPPPPQQWESWMSEQVKKLNEQNKNNSKMVRYTIPVVFHIVHAGEAVGTFPNIDAAQVLSQLNVLNADFNGTGAVGPGGTPSQFAPLVANTGIRFCLAEANPVGTPLVEPGIDRVNTVSNGWNNIPTMTVSLQSYFNNVIIPTTIWDPTRYLNVWVSSRQAWTNIRGWATYPAGTALNGLIGGSMGTGTNDGIWIWGRAFGTSGAATAPFNKGRTLTHEIGHWLGLRHIWGDGNCLDDYCSDTPTQKAPYYGGVLCSQTPTDQCGVNLSPFGEMPCNFMDMTDDDYKWMFTNDQNVRIQVAMSQCPNRYLLGTHGLCTYTPIPATSSAVASFVTPTSVCLGSPFTPFNTSSGYPYPTYVWSSAPAANFTPAITVANPAITFNNPGTYTLTLVATNSLSSSTFSTVISAQFSCQPMPVCIDTLRSLKNTDTLRTIQAPGFTFSLGCTSGFKGYLVGTNCYKDKEVAQYFPPSTFGNATNPQVHSVIVLFDSLGTFATNLGTQVYCKIYGGSVGNGPTSVIGLKGDSLGKIVKHPKVTSIGYVGSPYQIPIHSSPTATTKIIPFKFDLPSPVIVNPVSGFFAGVQGPLPNTGDSINIFSDNRSNASLDSSSWYLQNNGGWRNYRYGRGYKLHLAILPQITCSPITNIKEFQASLAANVAVIPNPSNGVFSMVFTLPTTSNLDLSVYNSIGQRVSQSTMSNIGNNVINLDLSDKPAGVYYAKIRNGSEEVVKKIIITH